MRTKLGRKIDLTIVTSKCDKVKLKGKNDDYLDKIKQDYSKSFNIKVDPINPDDLHDRHI